ncbi:hypothetical protein SAMN05720606_103139 [Paenibacillus polysaccharolyticus]|uniref:Uncharacterized protein n=1 Tax=Paenibacillus polysaccharolyticus TaxID=582692 RepID=A0A1G5E395_9BACL|nr:hypothetical protein SAMN05720606_103139 [Paenibacillus polysaccharolyticus]
MKRKSIQRTTKSLLSMRDLVQFDLPLNAIVCGRLSGARP